MSTEVLVKKDLILGGLTCAHCAEEIGKGVRKIDGIVDSNMNFVNKKLTVLFDSAYNEEEVIKAIIKKIDSIEVETKINTQMNKALCEVTEALADHAIATQGADGKVKRSLQTLETLKYQEY